MTYTMPYSWGPSVTPPVIRNLIIITCCITLLSSLTNNLFVKLLGMMGPQEVLGLSWWGLYHYFWWQPLTYVFVQDTPSSGISLFYLTTLFFNMYILWILGTSLQETIGTRHFLGLYFISAILGGLAAILVMQLTGHYEFIAGPSAALLALFVAWSIFYSESIISIFFIIPIKTKWLLVGVLGVIALVTLSQLDLVTFTMYLVAALCGYMYAVIAWGLQSPFPVTQKFDKALQNMGQKFHFSRKKRYSSTSSKIFDMHGDAILDDDAFIDSMLTKISKYGERSLTASERLRMQQISERKQRNKHKHE